MSTTIKQAIDSLKARIANAYAAVANKGGTLPTTQDSANLVSAIESIPAAEKAMLLNRGEELGDNILLIDFDGTILYAYTPEEIMELDELPKPYTTHENLTFSHWNISLEDLKRINRWHDVGAIYYPTDGCGELELDYIASAFRTAHLRMVSTESELWLDWGDGTIETLPAATDFDIYHTYAEEGRYKLKYKTLVDGATFNGLYVYNDTKKHVVGRCVMPTNASVIAAVGGGTNPSENTAYGNNGGLSSTMIDTLVIPPNCNVTQGNSASNLIGCIMLKCINISKPLGLWRTGSYFPATSQLKFITYPSFQDIHYAWWYDGFIQGNSLRSFDCNPLEQDSSGRSTSPYYGKIGGNLTSLERTNSYYLHATHSTWGIMGIIACKMRSISVSKGTQGTWWNYGSLSSCYNMEELTEHDPYNENFLWSVQSPYFQGNWKIRDYGKPFSSQNNAIPARFLANNYSLRKVSIWKTTKSLAASVFSNCYNLYEVHIMTSMVEQGYICTLANVNAFTNCPAEMKIYVPADSIEDYKAATNWSTFADQIYADPNQE